jgi:hypothetical protein
LVVAGSPAPSDYRTILTICSSLNLAFCPSSSEGTILGFDWIEDPPAGQLSAANSRLKKMVTERDLELEVVKEIKEKNCERTAHIPQI